jgi:hypothetical protein
MFGDVDTTRRTLDGPALVVAAELTITGVTLQFVAAT